MKKLPSAKFLLFNGAAVLLMGSAALVQLKQILFPKGAPVCSTRYERITSLPLERSGKLLSASDIQSAAYGDDFGVMTNLSIRRLKEGPAPVAFGISLEAGSAQPTHTQLPKGGVSFPWKPRTLPAGKSAACLGYSAFLPANFEFDEGGTLPGLFALKTDDLSPTADRVDGRLLWTPKGVSQFMLSVVAKTPQTATTDIDFNGPLPLGRWFAVEQELVLNTPKKADGLLRLWVDGVLRAEMTGLDLRAESDVVIHGVMADVHFGGTPVDTYFPNGKARKAEEIWLSPFELRWK
jgi:hypothetical protein